MVATRRDRAPTTKVQMSADSAKRGPYRPRHEGITVRHSRRCNSREGKRCNCDPGYQAQAYSRRDRKTLRKTFPTLAAAKAWRV